MEGKKEDKRRHETEKAKAFEAFASDKKLMRLLRKLAKNPPY